MKLRNDVLDVTQREYDKLQRVMAEAHFYADAPAEYAKRGKEVPVEFEIECLAKARLVFIERATFFFGKRHALKLLGKRVRVRVSRVSQ